MLGVSSFVKLIGPASLKSLLSPLDSNLFGTGLISRLASKKAGGSTKNNPKNTRPKHRRIHYQDGRFVQKGTLVVTQRTLRFHPGLNVGIGKNLSLVALEAGRVIVSCEKFDPRENHRFIELSYPDRPIDRMYKKYFNIIPEQQHCRFKRVD